MYSDHWATGNTNPWDGLKFGTDPKSSPGSANSWEAWGTHDWPQHVIYIEVLFRQGNF